MPVTTQHSHKHDNDPENMGYPGEAHERHELESDELRCGGDHDALEHTVKRNGARRLPSRSGPDRFAPVIMVLLTEGQNRLRIGIIVNLEFQHIALVCGLDRSQTLARG